LLIIKTNVLCLWDGMLHEIGLAYNKVCVCRGVFRCVRLLNVILHILAKSNIVEVRKYRREVFVGH